MFFLPPVPYPPNLMFFLFFKTKPQTSQKHKNENQCSQKTNKTTINSLNLNKMKPKVHKIQKQKPEFCSLLVNVNASSKTVLEKTDVPFVRGSPTLGLGPCIHFPFSGLGLWLTGTCVGLMHATVASVHPRSVIHQSC